jgi:imidazole glycerol phosphate synthase glutamine amidotransferase subunit
MVVILSTGVANVASVMTALGRLGVEPRLTEDVGEVERAGRVVLPGVGAFGAGMERLRALGAVEVLRARVEAGRPTLAVCLGLQLLCASSEEDPGVEGLGLVARPVRRFAGPVRVPQMGWNLTEPEAGCAMLERGYAYFANSYRLDGVDEGWSASYSDHGGRFVAGMERGAVLACQFHPELSGAWGLALLERWLKGGE